MTIDEAISYCLEASKKEEQKSKTGKWFEDEDWNIKAREQCAEYATMYTQWANWFTELEELKQRLNLLESQYKIAQDRITQLESTYEGIANE